MFKTIAMGSLVDNEPAEAPALTDSTARKAGETLHRLIERKGVVLTVLVLIALAIGGAVEIIPMLKIESNIPKIAAVTPYTPLELAGRDIYVANGCYNCHSQQIRPLRWETDRYGEYSKIGEFVYDHPFQWGSRRTGPDLSRAGWVGSSTYKTAIWHYNHFTKPKEINPQTIMPAYPWFAKNSVDLTDIPKKIRAMQTLGVPYAPGYDQKAVADYKQEAQSIVAELKASGVEITADKEIIAMIAYLHKLGRDISPANQK